MSINHLDVPSRLIVGLPFAGLFAALPREMPGIWASFLSRQGEIASVAAADVRYAAGRTFGDVYLECVGVEVSALEAVPHGMIALTLPGGRFARVTHRGPMSGVQQTYLQAFAAVEQAGLEIDPDRLRFERYDDRYLPPRDARERPENAYDIFLPVRPTTAAPAR